MNTSINIEIDAPYGETACFDLLGNVGDEYVGSVAIAYFPPYPICPYPVIFAPYAVVRA